MDVLGYLKERQNELERIDHPLSHRDLSFRYLYAFGVGVLALGDMKAITELQDKYKFFLECISIPKGKRDSLMIDINNHFEYRLMECIRILKTKEVQYCFFSDLYKLMQWSVWSVEYCNKVVKNFYDIFHMSESEIHFFEKFSEAAYARNLENAKVLYHDFTDAGFDISYQILQYFYPEFYDEVSYKDIVVKAGKTLHMDKPTHVSGDIVVERGGSLLLEGADLQIAGNITVNGGRIRMNNSKIHVISCKRNIFLKVEDAAVVHIENSEIDCNHQCGFLEQNTGRLLIEESEFMQSKFQRMIQFSGIFAKITRCSFEDGLAGFIEVTDSAQMHIEKSEFSNANAEYGGAFFSSSIDNVAIYDCSFRNCIASYLGGAVYFKYQKLGQVVKDCVCRMCEPEESVIFNVYEDDFELKVR